jgi:polyisoprenoid-binding protein YceI
MMRLVIAFTILMSLTFGIACNDPSTNQPKAATGAATQASPAQQSAAGTKYLITPQTSKIEFIGSKVTGSHNGSFERFAGDINYAGTPEKSRVNVTIETESLTADDANLTKHLKTADFFDVAKFPQATFESTEIKPGGENGASHTITGNLTLHGVTKSVTFPATINVTPDAANVDANFSINRKDFGINYAGAQDNLIRDNVVLKLTIRANKS